MYNTIHLVHKNESLSCVLSPVRLPLLLSRTYIRRQCDKISIIIIFTRQRAAALFTSLVFLLHTCSKFQTWDHTSRILSSYLLITKLLICYFSGTRHVGHIRGWLYRASSHSLHKNSRISAKPRNSAVKGMPPIFMLMRELKRIRSFNFIGTGEAVYGLLSPLYDW